MLLSIIPCPQSVPLVSCSGANEPASMGVTVKPTLLLLPIFLLCPLFASAQTPTLVQHVSCPNSRNTGNAQSSTPIYRCPLPEPAQAGNVVLVGVASYPG